MTFSRALNTAFHSAKYHDYFEIPLYTKSPILRKGIFIVQSLCILENVSGLSSLSRVMNSYFPFPAVPFARFSFSDPKSYMKHPP